MNGLVTSLGVVIGTVLFFLVPVLIAGFAASFLSPRVRLTVPAAGRRLAGFAAASHAGGLALYVAANAIPVSMEAVRVGVFGLAILLFAAVPCVLFLRVAAGDALPVARRLFARTLGVSCGLLGLLSIWTVWVATLAVRAVSGA